MVSSNDVSTQDRILKAAEDEFLDKGFAGARTVSIAANAGVTHAMLHYYFRTKDQLFQQVLNSKIEVLVNSVLQSFSDENVPVTQRIINAMRLHFAYMKESPRLPLFIARESQNIENILTVFRRHSDEVVSRLKNVQSALDKAAVAGEIAKTNVIDLVMDIISLNFAPFILKGILDPMLNFVGLDADSFLDQRLEENVELITRRLQRI